MQRTTCQMNAHAALHGEDENFMSLGFLHPTAVPRQVVKSIGVAITLVRCVQCARCPEPEQVRAAAA